MQTEKWKIHEFIWHCPICGASYYQDNSDEVEIKCCGIKRRIKGFDVNA